MLAIPISPQIKYGANLISTIEKCLAYLYFYQMDYYATLSVSFLRAYNTLEILITEIQEENQNTHSFFNYFYWNKTSDNLLGNRTIAKFY